MVSLLLNGLYNKKQKEQRQRKKTASTAVITKYNVDII